MFPINQDVIQASQYQQQNPNYEIEQLEIQNFENQQHQQTQSQTKESSEVVEKVNQIEFNNLENMINKGQHLLKQNIVIIKYNKWVNIKRQLNVMTKHWLLDHNLQIVQISKVSVYKIENQNNQIEKLGQYEQAIEWYDKALAINPQFVGCLHNRGVCLLIQAQEIIQYIIWVNMNRQLNGLRKHWPQIHNLQILQITKVSVYKNRNLKLFNREIGSI